MQTIRKLVLRMVFSDDGFELVYPCVCSFEFFGLVRRWKPFASDRVRMNGQIRKKVRGSFYRDSFLEKLAFSLPQLNYRHSQVSDLI